jgi:LuxR family maltose regulon positive regulatory protein
MLLRSGQPPVETVLTTVVNELSGVPDDLWLVLDDYHLVDGPGIAAGMRFLVEHLPPQAQLVVSTREDPDLATRSWGANPTACAASCSRPRSSTG